MSKTSNAVLCPSCGYLGSPSNDLASKVQALDSMKCPKCKADITVKNAALHLMEKHVKQQGKNYVCDICNAKLPSAGAAERHVLQHLILHTTESGFNKFICLVCGREFLTSRAAVAHMKAHY